MRPRSIQSFSEVRTSDTAGNVLNAVNGPALLQLTNTCVSVYVCVRVWVGWGRREGISRIQWCPVANSWLVDSSS